MHSTLLIASDLANQRVRKVLFTCVVYTNEGYTIILFFFAERVHGKMRREANNAGELADEENDPHRHHHRPSFPPKVASSASI